MSRSQSRTSSADLPDDGPVVKKVSDVESGAEAYGFQEFKCCCCGVAVALQLVLTAAGGSFIFGYCLAVLNTSSVTISAEYGWCESAVITDCDTAITYGALMNCGVFMGATVGAIAAQYMLPMGRRANLCLAYLIVAVGTICCLVSNSFSALFWGRIFVGYGVGMTSLFVPMYMAEVSPANVRGKYCAMHQLFITIGIFLAVLIGMPFSSLPEEDSDEWATWEPSSFDKIWWRVMLGLTLLPCIVSLYLFKIFAFETPHYYVENGHPEKAGALLRVILDKDDVTEELGSIERGVEEGNLAIANGMTLWKALGDKEYRFAILAGILLSSFFQLSGLNIFTTQSNALFMNAGVSGTLVTVLSTLLTFANVIMIVPALWMIDRLGRRTLMLAGTIGQTLAVLPSAILCWVDEDSSVAQWMSVASAIVFIIIFAATYGPVLWVFIFEIYPAEIKGIATSVAAAFHWVFAVVITYLNFYLNSNKITYTLLTVTNGVSIFIVVFMMRETKGRSIDDSPYFTKGKGVA